MPDGPPSRSSSRSAPRLPCQPGSGSGAGRRAGRRGRRRRARRGKHSVNWPDINRPIHARPRDGDSLRRSAAGPNQPHARTPVKMRGTVSLSVVWFLQRNANCLHCPCRQGRRSRRPSWRVRGSLRTLAVCSAPTSRRQRPSRAGAGARRRLRGEGTGRRKKRKKQCWTCYMRSDNLLGEAPRTALQRCKWASAGPFSGDCEQPFSWSLLGLAVTK